MFMERKEVNFMVKIKRKIKEQLYCKRCGAMIKRHFQISISPKKVIDVCSECFSWTMDKTEVEVKVDYKERNKKPVKKKIIKKIVKKKVVKKVVKKKVVKKTKKKTIRKK